VDRYSASAIGDGLHRVSTVLTDADYGNHSCDPNAWLDADGTTLVARRDIGPGEEVTTDYACWTDSQDWKMACNCGAVNCRGVIRGQDWRLPALQESYRGHWPAFLAGKIAALGDPSSGLA
jgi:hypothetical protein